VVAPSVLQGKSKSNDERAGLSSFSGNAIVLAYHHLVGADQSHGVFDSPALGITGSSPEVSRNFAIFCNDKLVIFLATDEVMSGIEPREVPCGGADRRGEGLGSDRRRAARLVGDNLGMSPEDGLELRASANFPGLSTKRCGPGGPARPVKERHHKGKLARIVLSI